MHGGAAGVIFGTKNDNLILYAGLTIPRYGDDHRTLPGPEARLLGVSQAFFPCVSLADGASFLGGVTRALNVSYLKAIPLRESTLSGWTDWGSLD